MPTRVILWWPVANPYLFRCTPRVHPHLLKIGNSILRYATCCSATKPIAVCISRCMSSRHQSRKSTQNSRSLSTSVSVHCLKTHVCIATAERSSRFATKFVLRCFFLATSGVVNDGRKFCVSCDPPASSAPSYRLKTVWQWGSDVLLWRLYSSS